MVDFHQAAGQRARAYGRDCWPEADALLSSILSTAVDDEVITGNPCLLVKTDTVPVKPLTIVTPTQFDKFHAALPDDMSRLLVETAIETGTRWGELTELRVQIQIEGFPELFIPAEERHRLGNSFSAG